MLAPVVLNSLKEHIKISEVDMTQEEMFDDTEELEEDFEDDDDFEDNDDDEEDEELMEFLKDNPIEKMFTVRDELEHMLDVCENVDESLDDIGPARLNKVLLEKVQAFTLNGWDYTDSCGDMMDMWSRYASTDEENLCLKKCDKVIHEIEVLLNKIDEIADNYVPVNGEMDIGKDEAFLTSAMAEVQYLF
jgi:hypothetical protein